MHRLVYSGKCDILPSTSTRATQAPLVKLPRHKLQQFVKGPSYQAASWWNALRSETRSVVDKSAFKVLIKRKLGKLFLDKWRHDCPYLTFEGSNIIAK